MEVKNIILVIVLVLIVHKYIKAVTNFNDKKIAIGDLIIIIPIVISGMNINVTIFSCILLCASYMDIKDRVVPDYLHIMIAILATDGMIYNRIVCLVIATLPMFIVTLSSGKVGGADLKLCMACNYYICSIPTCIIATMIACTLAIIANVLSKNKGGFAMIPYISIGYLIVISASFISLSII